MQPGPGREPAPGTVVRASISTSLTLTYSAPMPGLGSRYSDTTVAHEARILSVGPVGEALGSSGEPGPGECALEAALASLELGGFADPRATAYLEPLARSARLGTSLRQTLVAPGMEEVRPLLRALEVSGQDGPLARALRGSLSVGGEATLLDVMRFASGHDPLAREYATRYEVPREIARPAIIAGLSRGSSGRAALVESCLEVLSEVPDLDVASRAGDREAEEVSRMARGVLKAGGAHSRRGLEGIANLDGILREDRRLAPTATEPAVASAAFMVCLEHGPGALGHSLRPATGPGR